LTGDPVTLGQLVLDSARRHSGIALQFTRDGELSTMSYAELGRSATEIARGLIALGIQPGDRVAILGSTSADWALADYGAVCAGAVVTPIYHTNAPAECAYVLGHSESRLVFCEDSSQAAKVAQIRARCPQLEYVVVFTGTAQDAITLAELRRRGSEVPIDAVHERIAATEPQDTATLVYTSGTTGPPKACSSRSTTRTSSTSSCRSPTCWRAPPKRSCSERGPARASPAAIRRASSTSCPRWHRLTSPPSPASTRRSMERSRDASTTVPRCDG
jgi:long-chain acyl-CoA synthetase